jgi:hypothetical protein
MPPGADQPLDVGLHQHLQHRLRHASQKIAVSGLLRQRQSTVGHRILSRSWLKSRNSTLADRSDDHSDIDYGWQQPSDQLGPIASEIFGYRWNHRADRHVSTPDRRDRLWLIMTATQYSASTLRAALRQVR